MPFGNGVRLFPISALASYCSHSSLLLPKYLENAFVPQGHWVGAQIGARIGLRLKAEQLRILLSLLVLLPFLLVLLWWCARILPNGEATVVERARAVGEPI